MTARDFFLETLAIFIGDVLAVGFVSFLGYCAWRVLKYPGFRVGASWSFKGWDLRAMGRLPTGTDADPMEFTPEISIVSYEAGVKKIIHSIWVRERADVLNPGTILGYRDLKRAGVDIDARTTGGDLLNLQGPMISAPASKFHEVINFPIFIETSDGAYYKAQSAGNLPTGSIKFRYRWRDALHRVRQQFFDLRNYLRKRF